MGNGYLGIYYNTSKVDRHIAFHCFQLLCLEYLYWMDGTEDSVTSCITDQHRTLIPKVNVHYHLSLETHGEQVITTYIDSLGNR